MRWIDGTDWLDHVHGSTYGGVTRVHTHSFMQECEREMVRERMYMSSSDARSFSMEDRRIAGTPTCGWPWQSIDRRPALHALTVTAYHAWELAFDARGGCTGRTTVVDGDRPMIHPSSGQEFKTTTGHARFSRTNRVRAAASNIRVVHPSPSTSLSNSKGSSIAVVVDGTEKPAGRKDLLAHNLLVIKIGFWSHRSMYSYYSCETS